MIEQAKTKPQETLEIRMCEQKQTFPFSPPIKLTEEGKCLLGVTSFEATSFFFNLKNGNKSFSISIPSYWTSRGDREKVIRLREILELREENDIELHVKEVKKRGNQSYKKRSRRI